MLRLRTGALIAVAGILFSACSSAATAAPPTSAASAPTGIDATSSVDRPVITGRLIGRHARRGRQYDRRPAG